jgi:hypothetical protein
VECRAVSGQAGGDPQLVDEVELDVLSDQALASSYTINLYQVSHVQKRFKPGYLGLIGEQKGVCFAITWMDEVPE